MINLLQTTTAPADTAAVSMAEKINGTIEALSNASVKEIIAGLSESIIGFGLKVLAAFAIYIVGTWVIRKLKNIVSKIFIKRKIDKAISSFVISLMSITLLVILIIAIIGILGIDTTSFAALLAAGGLAIGMALSGTVQNFAGGVMILLFKPFKIGDFIEAQGYMGTVSDISIANTQLSTIDNKIVIIPNGVLSNGTMTNFSSNKLRKVEWLVDVEYGSSSKLVKSVLTDIISADSRILNKQSGANDDPLIELKSLRDSSVQFLVRAWVKQEDYWPVNFSINEEIYTTLPEKGINFPFPQMDVHIKQQ